MKKIVWKIIVISCLLFSVVGISQNDKIEINAETCIFCCACLKTCPVECISLQTTPMEEKAKALSANCKERKEPQLFF